MTGLSLLTPLDVQEDDDFVGLDVSAAIGREIGASVPPKVHALIAEGALGRKSGRGFYNYG